MNKLPSVMTTYVAEMNVAFGNAPGFPHQYVPGHADYDKAWGRLQKQCENIGGKFQILGRSFHGDINGEVLELLTALHNRDMFKTRDALCDIMVFALGAYHFMGYSPDADMVAVLNGVMTRFCRTQEEIEQTQHKWMSKGITALEVGGELPYCYVKAAADQTTFDGEQIPKGKFLKSVGYKDTDFPPAPPVPEARNFIGMPQDNAV